MSGWPRLRFCEAPTLESATRLDLHNAGVAFNGDVTTLAEGFTLGVPSLSSPTGARVQVLGDRSAKLALRVAGTKQAAVARLNAVARELMRPTNWLEFQVAAETEPRWLQTFASVPEPVSLERVHDDPARRDSWVTALALTGAPLAVGPVRQLGEWTIANHPTTGGHPMRVELPEVEGEAAAPLLVKITKDVAGGILGPALGVARVAPVVSAAPGSWGSAVGSAVTDASMVGGSYRQTTGDLSAWTAVGTWTPTGLPSGHTRWTVLLRVAGSTGQGAFRARWRVQAAGVSSVLYSQPVVVDVEQQSRWVRTGEVPCPMLDLSDGLGLTAATTLTLEVQRITPGGELRVDAPLVLVPAGPGSDLLLTSPDPIAPATVTVLVDADQRRVAMAAGTAPARTPGVAGGWPHVLPGEPNVLSIWQSLDPTIGAGVNDQITSTVTVTASYRPHFLWGV